MAVGPLCLARAWFLFAGLAGAGFFRQVFLYAAPCIGPSRPIVTIEAALTVSIAVQYLDSGWVTGPPESGARVKWSLTVFALTGAGRWWPSGVV